MKNSMFESEKSDILKDMYGEDLSLLEDQRKETPAGFSVVNRSSYSSTAKKPVRSAAPTRKTNAQPWTRPAPARPASTRSRVMSAEKQIKSGSGWLAVGICAFVFSVILATLIGTSGMKSVLMPSDYQNKLSDMLDQGQYARAVEFIEENQLDDYDKKDAAFAPLVTRAKWENKVVETIDDWQLFVSILSGNLQADATGMTWDLASNMEELCAPSEAVIADVPYNDVKRGQDAVRGMLLMLGDDGTVFEAMCSEDYDQRAEAAQVLESTLDSLALQATDQITEDIPQDTLDQESTRLLEEEA